MYSRILPTGSRPFSLKRALNMLPRQKTQAQRESAAGLPRQIPSDLGGDHRAARECGCVPRAEPNAVCFLGGDGQREEGIVRGFRNPDGVKPKILGALNLLCIMPQVARQSDRYIQFYRWHYRILYVHKIRQGPCSENQAFQWRKSGQQDSTSAQKAAS